MPPEESAVAATPVSESVSDTSADTGGSTLDDIGESQLDAFFGDKPAERETPNERGAPEKTEQPAGDKPAATNHQAAEPEQPETDGFDEETLALAELQGYTAEEA